jgi:hypothetical protein
VGIFDGFVSPGVVIALVLLAVAMGVAHLTPFGRAVYAVGGNEQSAHMMGLPVGATKVAVYAISGGCAALGGLLFAFYMLSGYGLHAQGTELDAIAAVRHPADRRLRLCGRRTDRCAGAGRDPDPDRVRRHPQFLVDQDRDWRTAVRFLRVAKAAGLETEKLKETTC